MNNCAARIDGSTGADFREDSSNATVRRFFVFLLIVTALHVIFRGGISETVGIDDADQIVRAQIWSWGYGPQPPLYTWLLKIFLTIFGYNIYAVTALKELALLGISLLAFANARLLTRSNICAIAAAMAIQFNPSISWESHRELTHSILTSFFVLATIYCFLRLNVTRWTFYLFLGTCAALGILSKPNYLFFLAALLLAGLSVKETRSIILNRKMIVAGVVALLLCAPNLNWILKHRELATSSIYKFKVGEGEVTMGKALLKWATDLIAHLLPTLGIFALIFFRVFSKAKLHNNSDKLLLRTFLWILGLATASIVIFKVTGFRDRWLQPLFVWLPLLSVGLLRDQIVGGRYKAILWLGGAIMVVVLILAPGRMLLTERLKKNEILNSPYRKLTADLQPLLRDTDSIIVGDYRIAGNLRLCFPDKFVTSPEFADLFPRVSGRSVLVWDNPNGTPPPRGLLKFAESMTGKTNAIQQQTVNETLKYHQSKTMQLGVAFLE